MAGKFDGFRVWDHKINIPSTTITNSLGSDIEAQGLIIYIKLSGPSLSRAVGIFVMEFANDHSAFLVSPVPLPWLA
ncbi:hypothetical protein BZZ01_31940 [Nostocales cyanobacterium HT-58-2]|nr:hypothetical protein BZZ01_31940 [Nostocales cyanobacterium HT-58-2]